MGQGRISFSRSSAGSRGFRPGRDSAFDFGDFLTAGDPLHHSRPRAEAHAPPRVPFTDDWVREGIERKRVQLAQISILHRARIDEFVEMLFDEESDRCGDMLDIVLLETGDPQKVVELLLEPAARVIGENWCADECDFLKVTLGVSRMQRLFRRMAADFAPTAMPDMSRCVLLTPAPGEQHTFGLSVVDDAFRRAGWEVDCCGCDEEAEIYRLVAANRYQVLGISVSVERRLSDLTVMSRKLRSKSRNQSIVLIAGGSMVMQNPQGAMDAGFDLLAFDAVSAVALADAVVASSASGDRQRLAAE